MNTIIIFEIVFKEKLAPSDQLLHNYTNKKFIGSVCMDEFSEEDSNKRTLILTLKKNINYKDLGVNLEVQNTIKELIYKLKLRNIISLPTYFIKEIRGKEKCEICDVSKSLGGLLLIPSLPSEEKFKEYLVENINFEKHQIIYQKIIKILYIDDDVIKYLILYDLFLSLVSSTKKVKQENVVKYINEHKLDLEKVRFIGFTNYNFVKTQTTGKDEDDLTQLRNDIAHSEKRNSIKEFNNLGERAGFLINPLVYAITHFLSHN